MILLGVVEENDHSLSVRGVEDSHKLIGDFWNIVNNRQKVSINILTNNMVYAQEIDGKKIVVIEVPRADRTIRPINSFLFLPTYGKTSEIQKEIM